MSCVLYRYIHGRKPALVSFQYLIIISPLPRLHLVFFVLVLHCICIWCAKWRPCRDTCGAFVDDCIQQGERRSGLRARLAGEALRERKKQIGVVRRRRIAVTGSVLCPSFLFRHVVRCICISSTPWLPLLNIACHKLVTSHFRVCGYVYASSFLAFSSLCSKGRGCRMIMRM